MRLRPLLRSKSETQASCQRTQEITIPMLEAATSDLTAIHLRLTLFAFAGHMLPDMRSLFEANAKQP
jgi:hypothetical protein